MTKTAEWIKIFFYQFWSPLLMTEEARHNFSLTDQGSVGPTFSILCSVGNQNKQSHEKIWNMSVQSWQPLDCCKLSKCWNYILGINESMQSNSKTSNTIKIVFFFDPWEDFAFPVVAVQFNTTINKAHTCPIEKKHNTYIQNGDILL